MVSLSVTTNQLRLGLSCHSGRCFEELKKGHKLLLFFVCIWQHEKYHKLFGGIYTIATVLTKTVTLTKM